MKYAATLLLVLATSLHAQEAATITIRRGDTTSIRPSSPLGGGDGATAGKVLQNDLELSAGLSLTPAERATYVVGGSASGGSLQGQVTDQRGSVVLQKTYSGGTRAAAHAFADDIVETVTGHKGIASSKIAFVSTRSGRKEIYTADYDGANVKQLTTDGSISVGPALCRRTARSWPTPATRAAMRTIYLIDLASGARNRIVKFPGTNSGAAFSPDGGRIACSLSKDGNPELYVVRSQRQRQPGV